MASKKKKRRKLKPGTALELPQEFIVLAIPDTTVDLDIRATVIDNGEPIRVGKSMDFREVRDAIREALNGYIPSDAVFTLTPTREEKLRELIERYAFREDKDE